MDAPSLQSVVGVLIPHTDVTQETELTELTEFRKFPDQGEFHHGDREDAAAGAVGAVVVLFAAGALRGHRTRLDPGGRGDPRRGLRGLHGGRPIGLTTGDGQTLQDGRKVIDQREMWGTR